MAPLSLFPQTLPLLLACLLQASLVQSGFPPQTTTPQLSAHAATPANKTALGMRLEAEGDSLTVRWTADSSDPALKGFVVTYRQVGHETYDSSLLDKSVRQFSLHSLHTDTLYQLCVQAKGNVTSMQRYVCQEWEKSSMKILVGILAGIIFLIPCAAAFSWILYKDFKVKQAKAASQRDPESAHSLMATANHNTPGLPTATGNDKAVSNSGNDHWSPGTTASSNDIDHKSSGTTDATASNGGFVHDDTSKAIDGHRQEEATRSGTGQQGWQQETSCGDVTGAPCQGQGQSDGYRGNGERPERPSEVEGWREKEGLETSCLGLEHVDSTRL